MFNYFKKREWLLTFGVLIVCAASIVFAFNFDKNNKPSNSTNDLVEKNDSTLSPSGKNDADQKENNKKDEMNTNTSDDKTSSNTVVNNESQKPSEEKPNTQNVGDVPVIEPSDSGVHLEDITKPGVSTPVEKPNVSTPTEKPNISPPAEKPDNQNSDDKPVEPKPDNSNDDVIIKDPSGETWTPPL